MPQLKKLALDYGVNVRLPPDLNEVIGGGDFYNPYESKTTSRPKKRAKPKLTRGDYINSLMRVPFDYLTDFCDKNRIYVDNIVIDNISGVAKIKNYPKEEVTEEIEEITEEEKDVEKDIEEDVKSFLKIIEKEFNPQEIRDETEFEGNLVQWLEGKFGNELKIRRQVQTSRGRVDIIINDKILLELKLITSEGVLDKLYGQLRKYLKLDKMVVAILLDTGKINPQRLNEWKDNYEKELGVYSLVFRGKHRKIKKNKGRVIIER